jgi:hypothetical protein
VICIVCLRWSKDTKSMKSVKKRGQLFLVAGPSGR